MIDNIMIFAAGRGNRMEHLSKNQPKSSIQILGKKMLHYALELAITYPFKKIIINTHYLHRQIEDAVEEFKATCNIEVEIITIYEPELLETGGAVKNAKYLLGIGPIFALNSDIIIKCNTNLFHYMISRWESIKVDSSNKIDLLLLLQPTKEAVGYTKNGDFEIKEDSRLSRPIKISSVTENHNYMYAGMQILDPSIIYANSKEVFSISDYFLNNSAFGVVAPDECYWYHANTPEDIIAIENALQDKQN